MITKRQLIKVLEPFDDDIEIIVLSEHNYKYEPRIFYYLGNDEAQILFVTQFEPQGKAAELKIK